MDARITQYADVIVNYALRLAEGDRFRIDWSGAESAELVRALIRSSAIAGATPIWNATDEIFTREFLRHATEPQVKAYGAAHRTFMEECNTYFAIRGSANIFELSDLPTEPRGWHLNHFQKHVHLDYRVKKMRWAITRYPTAGMAQLAEMTTDAFTDFYFQSVLIDYAQLSRAMQPLRELMERTDRVRIVARDTELAFSIKGIPAIPCDGHVNLPDGEVFTAPVRNSVNGQICFNASTPYQGQFFPNVRLTFKDGRIMHADCDGDSQALNALLDVDDGARYIGEFAIGFHPTIRKPIRDILFDEKIAGSLHLALGACYDDASNGNTSVNHWDLVLIQRPEYGGGEIWFDDRLIRKDGMFVVPELDGLNPAAFGAPGW